MNKQERSLYQFYRNEKIILSKKIEHLRNKDKKDSISNIVSRAWLTGIGVIMSHRN